MFILGVLSCVGHDFFLPFLAIVRQKCDKSNSGSLEGSEIKHFYDLLTHREEIDVIYAKYAQTEGQMSAANLLNFLLNEQRETVSMEHAVKLIEKYELDDTGKMARVTVKLIGSTCTLSTFTFICIPVI